MNKIFFALFLTLLYWVFKSWIFLMWPMIPLYLSVFIALFWKDLRKDWIAFLKRPAFSLPLTLYLFARLHGGPVGEVGSDFESLWFVFAPLWFYIVLEDVKSRPEKTEPGKVNPVANGFKWALFAFIVTFG